MELLKKINWNFERGKFDTSTLTGMLQVVYAVDISNEQYYYAEPDKQTRIFNLSKKQIEANISKLVFEEVIDMLRIEANAMIQSSFKCTDFRDSEIMRECARKLLLMASKMEVPE